jgi:hypothetical protein
MNTGRTSKRLQGPASNIPNRSWLCTRSMRDLFQLASVDEHDYANRPQQRGLELSLLQQFRAHIVDAEAKFRDDLDELVVSVVLDVVG